MEDYVKLKQLVDQINEDVFKAVGGNKAAGTRVRKAMQDIKNLAQDIRKKMLGMRGEGEDDAESAAAGGKDAE